MTPMFVAISLCWKFNPKKIFLIKIIIYKKNTILMRF